MISAAYVAMKDLRNSQQLSELKMTELKETLMRHERTIIQSEERQNTLTIELEKERAFSKRWEDKLHKNEVRCKIVRSLFFLSLSLSLSLSLQ